MEAPSNRPGIAAVETANNLTTSFRFMTPPETSWAQAGAKAYPRGAGAEFHKTANTF
jgi:hypothetical protein